MTRANSENILAMGADDMIGDIIQEAEASLTAQTSEPPTEMVERMALMDNGVGVQPRDILKLSFRQRAQTLSVSENRQSPRRRRLRSLNVSKTNSPTRQLKITDLIISQQGEPEEKE